MRRHLGALLCTRVLTLQFTTDESVSMELPGPHPSRRRLPDGAKRAEPDLSALRLAANQSKAS